MEVNFWRDVWKFHGSVNPLDSKGNYSATSNNTKLVHWPLMVGCYIWYNEEGHGRAVAPPSPLLAVPNVTAHPSTASLLITVLLYDGPLLCGFSVAITGLKWKAAVDAFDRIQTALRVRSVAVRSVALSRSSLIRTLRLTRINRVHLRWAAAVSTRTIAETSRF